jgi:septal ring factor EnvC (AmiA/AmiB activator)
MKTVIKYRLPVIMAFFLMAAVFTQAQSFSKAAELRNLNKKIAEAKAKVVLNEKKVSAADSLINLGSRMISESKKETKAAEAERRKLDRNYAVQKKSLAKLTTSKNREESTKARADLKALSTQYRSDIKTLTNRLRESTKKLSKGESNLKRGKAARKSAMNALKASKAVLKDAQAKYDEAYFSGGNTDPNKTLVR